MLSCMSLTLPPEKNFTLTLRFWDSRPGCRPETIESPAMQIVPWIGHGQSSLLTDVTLYYYCPFNVRVSPSTGVGHYHLYY